MIAGSVLVVPTGAAAAETQVTIHSRSAILAASLLRPADTTIRGAGIVLVHGSGAATREGVRPMAERFVSAGMTALIYDKRGTGESTGSWTDASLDDLAEDAAAAVALLREQPEVDPRHVGVWGISQGGWVIARMFAANNDAASFVIAISGGGLKPADVERYDYRATLVRAGATTAQQQQGMQIVEQYLTYLRTGRDRARLEASMAEHRDEPWFRAMNLTRVLPSETTRAKWAWVATYDPVADLRRIRVPTLVLLGSRDRPELLDRLRLDWETAFAASGTTTGTVVVVSGAGHGIVADPRRHMAPQVPFALGYPELVVGWARAAILP